MKTDHHKENWADKAEPRAAITTVAIIGSFRQHYPKVKEAWVAFSEVGLTITSPKGTPIRQHGIPFVRFESDPEDWTDGKVQTVALHRIFRAQFIYVVAPEGYVGRTTCYEIGRAIQAQRPIYFSEHPRDLPVYISQEHILDLTTLLSRLRTETFAPVPMYCEGNRSEDDEKDLLLGLYQKDEHFGTAQ